MQARETLNFGWGRQLPMLLQTEAAECGLACLAMVAGFFGHSADTAGLRRRFGQSLRGATLKQLVTIADQLALASRPVRLEMSELGMLRLPCVLHWDLNHFVVLKRVGRADVVIHDPAMGVRRLSFAQASRHFTGVALELTPTGGFAPSVAPPRVRLRALIGHMAGLGRSLGQLAVLALALEVFGLVSPFFLAWVVDQSLVSGDHDLLVTLVLGFSLLLLLQTAISAMRGWMLIALGASVRVQARTNLFSHLLSLPAAYFEQRYMADILSRFGSQETLVQTITTEVVVAVMDGLMCCLTLGIMLFIAPVLTTIAFAAMLLYVALRWLFYTPLRQASMETIVWDARRDSHFLETLRGIKTIKLFNGQDERRAHWLNLLVESVNRQLTTQKLGLLFGIANSLLFGGLGIVVIWLGAEQVLAKAFSVGMLLAYIAYKDQFVRRAGELTNRVVDLQMLRLHAERLGDIALTAPEPRGGTADLAPRLRHPVGIEVRDLCFRYGSNDPWLLEWVSFRIEPGESVAIVGASGCGKTTLLKLMAGLLQTNHGEILVDGEKLERFGIDRYRSMIGVVMQDDQLFAGSIADNISFFSPTPDHDGIVASARMASVHDDIAAMPMGYGTLIGDMGAVLSGGQKQRVLIARALYRKPSILFLDEATSHLDIEREAAVNASVGSLPTTRVVIAHRTETIRAAQRVISLQPGRVPVPA